MISGKFCRENFETLSKNLHSKKVCVLPTDTIFGFSAVVSAASEIARIKKRALQKPFVLLFPDFLSAEKAVEFSPLARRLFADFSMPITFVLPRKKAVFSDFFPEENFLAIRVPRSLLLVKFLHFFGAPILSTSVNLAGEIPLFDISAIDAHFPEIPIFSEEKPSFSQNPSGMVKIKGDTCEILRGGNIFCEEIQKRQLNFSKTEKNREMLLTKGGFWER